MDISTKSTDHQKPNNPHHKSKVKLNARGHCEYVLQYNQTLTALKFLEPATQSCRGKKNKIP